MTRAEGRKNNELREFKIRRNYIPYAEGSALVELGKTKVICTASVEGKSPQWLKGSGKGWITSEYGMIPRSCQERVSRESRTLRVGGRTHEIQRIIGRSLRSVTNLDMLDEITIWLDCDVIVADGGTRVASICGAFVALYDAIDELVKGEKIPYNLVTDYVAAISVGIVEDEILLDLDYFEDSKAQADFNLVKSGIGKFIEVQGTAEDYPFSKEQFEQIIEMGNIGIEKIINIQRDIIGKDIYAEYQKNYNSQSEQREDSRN